MAIANSKVTAQGQISVPAEVCKKLGIGPGSVLEWDEQDGQIIVRRAGRYNSKDVHEGAFPEGSRKTRLVDVKNAIRTYTRRQRARD
jgi:AbrB family looped-hinge helix DNA binding protein